MDFQKTPDKSQIETINILLYYFKHIYINLRRMLLGNKYNHSIDLRRGEWTLVNRVDYIIDNGLHSLKLA